MKTKLLNWIPPVITQLLIITGFMVLVPEASDWSLIMFGSISMFAWMLTIPKQEEE